MFGKKKHHQDQSRSIARRPVIEGLEHRTLFAASAVEPFIDTAGVLQVGGTNKSDVIVVTVDTDAATVSVSVNGVVSATPFTLAAITHVQVDGGNGHDDISVVEQGATPSTLAFKMTGGNGKDSLAGGSGNDELDGGNGKDTLVGNAGDDTLTGGRSKDDLTGGDGADHFVNDKTDKLDDPTEGIDVVDVVNQVKPKGPKK